MKAIDIDPQDLFDQAEKEIYEQQTKIAVAWLKRQIVRRDELKAALDAVEKDIETFSSGDWSIIPSDSDCPYNRPF